MRFKRFTFSFKSPLLGFHIGRNPVSGQRFVHVAPFPFFGIDFNLPPYDLNDEARARLAEPATGLIAAGSTTYIDVSHLSPHFREAVLRWAEYYTNYGKDK